MAAPNAPTPEVDEPMAMRWSIGRIAAVVVVLAMVLFWIWIWSGAPAKRNPDWLADRAYASTLERRCEQLRDDLAELPPPVETPQANARADVLEQANALVADFVRDLEAGAPTTGDAATVMGGWIADWKAYLANREDYVERLRADAGARFLVDESEFGDSVDKTIAIFAQVNEIEACETPGDVG